MVAACPGWSFIILKGNTLFKEGKTSNDKKVPETPQKITSFRTV